MIDPNQIGITPQDQQMLRLFAQGCTDKEIASYLNVSPPTAKQLLLTLFVELLNRAKTGPIPRLAVAPTAERKSIG
jgi:DNA-binding NarL/FixJ family response regulator